MNSLIDLYKSRSGVYKDTPQNRRLKRVGQRYGNNPDYIDRLDKFKKKGLTSNASSLEEFDGVIQRLKRHKEIVKEYSKRSTKHGKEPIAVFTLGGSGAGKSTVLNLLKTQNSLYSGIAVVDSDDIKTKSFKEDFVFYNYQNPGSAAGRLHKESSIVADKIIDDIQSIGNDYLKDGTMKSFDKAYKEIMSAKSKGYRVNIIATTISVEEALKRATMRAVHTGRFIAESVIVEAHVGSTNTFLKLVEMGILDEAKLYDNSGSEPVLIYDSLSENPIIDNNLFKEFKNKLNYGK